MSTLGDSVKEQLAQHDEDDPYVDEFGRDITGHLTDDVEYDDELLVHESSGDKSDTDTDSDA